MSWQDDPVAGGWQQDPIATNAAPSAPAPAPQGLMDRIAGSDIGQAIQHPIKGLQEIVQDPAKFGRQTLGNIGSVGRGAFDASIAIPGMAADAAYQAKNLIAGTNDALPTEVVNQGLDQAMGQTQAPLLRGTAGLLLGSKIPLPGTAPKGALLPGAEGVPNEPAVAPQGTPAPSRLTPAQQQAAAAGKDLGMKLTPGKATGSVPLQQIEAKLESQPWTSGPFAKVKEANQTVLNRTWAKAIGETSDHVDSTVLGRAVDRLGQVFESVGDPKSIRIVNPEDATNTIAEIDKEFAGLLPNNASITTNPLVQQFKELSDTGALTGEQLQQLSSKLGKSAAKQMTQPSGDRDMGQALYQVKNAVDDLLQEGLSKADQVSFSAARKQYRNLMLLTRRASSINPSSGNVNARSLAGALQSADKRGYLFGQNQSDAYNAVRFGQAFPSIVGDSGTATRSGSPLGMFASAPLGIPANLASRAYMSGLGSKAIGGYQTLSRTSLPPGYLGAMAPLTLP